MKAGAPVRAGRKGAGRRGPSRRVVLVIAGVVTALAALIGTGVALAARPGQVATLAGHPVTRDELLFHLRRLAPTVQNELHNRFHLQTPITWAEKTGDRTALQRLTERALDDIHRDKTTLLLAQEQGLIDSPDHDAFLAALDAENARRADAVTKGEVVYGLAEFSPEQYYSHHLTELTTALKQRLAPELAVTDAEVRRAFDADRDAWSANATTYTYAKLVVPIPDDAPAGYARDLQRRVAAADDLKQVAEREPGATLTTATHQGGGTAAAHDRDLTAVLGGLDPGQVSAPVPGTGQITYYELDGETVDAEAAFAAYARRIRQSLIEEKFTQFLQRRVDSTPMRVDAAAVDAINAEDARL
ncbi:hypothetical protein FXF51_44870 [Nonomuraea sp. PA05]|uniref:hypothetical protein n=1 Tax=Nonomuraea sp. PA05 TaxID=2604466 RepID=UPI0011D5D1F4|nr:hypothetical protein [Nonomuraea sp. PA05]TYB55957.1 hypothetical protein FXF51_44870 [Nonomuraea sp. PA05]